jgi:hypothetical protein
MTLKGKPKYLRKPCLSTTLSTKILHGLAWNWTGPLRNVSVSRTNYTCMLSLQNTLHFLYSLLLTSNLTYILPLNFLIPHWKRVGAKSVLRYRVIKRSLCTWWLQYRKLPVMFKVFSASLQTLLGSIWLLGSRPPGPGHYRLTLTPSVIPKSNYVVMVRDWNCLKYWVTIKGIDTFNVIKTVSIVDTQFA